MVIILLLFQFVQRSALSANSLLSGQSQADRVRSTVKTANSFFTKTLDNEIFGKLIDARNDTDIMQNVRKICSRKRLSSRKFPTDQESVDAIEKYFWGMSEGIVMELGALNGKKYSESYAMKDLGWHRILVEASPYFSALFPVFSVDSYSFATAICENDQKVHFRDQAATGGIIEFMPPSLLKDFNSDIFNTSRSNWTSLPFVYLIECLPLYAILRETRVKHVNFFILDVEGAELSVLRTIKYDEVLFDVMVIETDPANRPTNYSEDVTKYLSQFGYVKSWEKTRNTWFTHSSFVPFPRPVEEDHSVG